MSVAGRQIESTQLVVVTAEKSRSKYFRFKYYLLPSLWGILFAWLYPKKQNGLTSEVYLHPHPRQGGPADLLSITLFYIEITENKNFLGI